MGEIALMAPREEYLLSYLDFCREMEKAGNRYFTLHPSGEFDTWKDTIFTSYENFRKGINLPEGYVPSSTFWLVEEGQVIGAGSVRHCLNTSLERFGGHIGYGIHPKKWGQGYGSRQLKLLLFEAYLLCIDKALITCDDTNLGSARVIEKNGGILLDTTENLINEEPRLIRRYHVPTAPPKREQLW